MKVRLSRLLPLVFACAAFGAQAQGWSPATVFVQGGSGEDEVGVASFGAAWPWAWKSSFLGTEVTGATELFVSTWGGRRANGSRDNFVQIGVVPMFRFRPDAGRSAWFFEAGIGVAVHDERYVTRDKTFGSSWNFSDNFAVGRNFGAKGQHELSLRWQHTSNAGLKKPNPGMDVGLIRYGYRF